MNAPKPAYKPNLKITSMPGMALLAVIALIIILTVVGLPKDWRADEGFLGTSASFMSDITLLAYVFLLLPLMLIGGVFALRKQFVPQHQVIMTTVVILNWGLIAFIMAASFGFVREDIPNNLNDSYYLLPGIHFLIGLAAQLMGTYLVIRMWFEDELPAALKIKNIKTPMRLTLVGWIIAALLGIGTYFVWYGDDSATAGDDLPPVATEEPSDIQPSPDPDPEPDDDDDDDDPIATPEADPEPSATEDAN